jgi:hypothetical protein
LVIGTGFVGALRLKRPDRCPCEFSGCMLSHGNRVDWYDKLARVSARGVRVTGDTTWPSKKDWRHFCDYEDPFHEVIGNQRRAVLCTYPLASCGAPQILDVVRTQQFVLARRHGGWDVVETASLKQAKAEIKVAAAARIADFRRFWTSALLFRTIDVLSRVPPLRHAAQVQFSQPRILLKVGRAVVSAAVRVRQG